MILIAILVVVAVVCCLVSFVQMRRHYTVDDLKPLSNGRKP